MGNIVLLDELTINKIAAGEVIERPASVVKEMVENSIDAGATNITVEIKNGGISYIRVSDNGKGIASDDLEIAFERHATSKIRSADDLSLVKSMGFRGEALASIAAIANVELVSKTENQEIGYRVVVEGGDILSKEESGCPTGTTITVKNLFFNTPVRYKFLRKDYTESGYIEDVITRLAQVHPEISFRLINTGKTIIQTNGNGDLKTVIYSIYGKDIAEKLINVDYQYEDIKITGAIGKPEIARSNRSSQMFFINKRHVKDKILQSATEQAFKGLIPLGRFAFLSLNIEMDPAKLDVNVHPAKLEVRFENEDKMFKAIYHAIKDSLLRGNQESNAIYSQIEKLESKENMVQVNKTPIVKPKIDLLAQIKEQELRMQPKAEEKQQLPVAKTFESKYVLPKEGYVQAITEDLEKPKTLEKEENDLSFMQELLQNKMERKEEIKYEINQEPEQETKVQEPEEKEENNQETQYDYEEMYMKTFGAKPYKKIEQSNVNLFENIETYQTPEYKIVGIVFNTYIVIEMKDEMYVIDQHAAHERIMYEKIKKNYYSGEEKESQLMLLPDIITLTHKEMDAVRENMEMFEKAGFMLEEFGENTIKLSGVPEMCLDLETKEMFLETLDEITALRKNSKTRN